MKIFEWATWIMFGISFVISVITILVLFGLLYASPIKPFTTLKPFEVSLAVTLFMWGIDSIYASYVKKSKSQVKFSILLLIFSGITLTFMLLGVY